MLVARQAGRLTRLAHVTPCGPYKNIVSSRRALDWAHSQLGKSMILSSSENSKAVSMAATIVAHRDVVPPLPSRNEQVGQHQPPTYQRMLP